MGKARQASSERLWFRRKTYGWGWTPATWEGWLTTLLAVIAIFAAAYLIDPDQRPLEFVGVMVIIVGLLLLVSYRKGERPGWSGGR